jgi:hypothetical protein
LSHSKTPTAQDLNSSYGIELSLSVRPRVRNVESGSTTRQSTAVFGILAILFQALGVGWHHHTLFFASRYVAALDAVAVTAEPETPLAAHDDCELCFALSHQRAVSVDIFVAALPKGEPIQQLWISAVALSLPAFLLFQPRAPPPV